MKILILSASPVRDKHLDELIAEKLTARGHEVIIKPCLREGRDSVMEYQPNVVVTPPIRNPFSRDLVEVIKSWGIGVVSRHTEPSCDWQDYKKMDERQRMEILGGYPYYVDVELVWSQDEAEILSRRPARFRTVPVGAIGLDIYHDELLRSKLSDRESFNKKYNFNHKKSLIIASPWGFADSAPDLRIDDINTASLDEQGKARHLDMIRKIHSVLKDEWNIIVTIHPGVVAEPYAKLTKELGIPLDAKSPMMDLLLNCDALVHAGSTAAISAHICGKPAYQFGDVNVKDSNSWWGMPESTISQVSPYFKTAEELAEAIKKYEPKTNANVETIEKLEKGRYGTMDGKATDRAVEEICKVKGEFKLSWPKAHRDYDQLFMFKYEQRALAKQFCGICKNEYFFVHPQYKEQIATALKFTDEQKKIMSHQIPACPHCAARYFTNQ